LHGPLLWFYTLSLVSSWKFKKTDILHLLPFTLFVVNLALRFWFVPENEKTEVITNESFKTRWTYYFFVSIIALSIPIYLFYSYKSIKRHQLKLKDYYSTIDNNSLNWLSKLFFYAMSLYSILGIIHVLDMIFHFTSYKIYQSSAFTIASIFILILGFFAHKQTSLFTTFQPLGHEGKKEDSLEVNGFLSKLELVMNSSKPYLKPSITIHDLAKQLDVSPLFLSNFLNNELSQNFYLFINKYRIEEFKRLISENKFKSYSILGIAYECGFNSKASFYRVFKILQNSTPSAYIDKSQKK
jgi:AraC-like DNA-binding protein